MMNKCCKRIVHNPNRFDISKFVAFHGRGPRGLGLWVFDATIGAYTRRGMELSKKEDEMEKKTEKILEPSRPAKMKKFFGCTNTELLAFKREDPKGFEQVGNGIEDGTFTY